MVHRDGKNLREILESKSLGNYERFLYIESQAKDILPKIRIAFPEFNNHDIKHAENVEKILDDLIPKTVKKSLNCDEILFLLSSAWLHDIGMVLEKSEEEIFINANRNEKEQISKKTRNLHHIRSYTFIKKNAVSFNLNERQAEAIGNICRAHRSINIKEELNKTYKADKDEVRLQFLGACLRLAHECDISHRVSKYFLEESRSALDFIPHMRKTEIINSISFNEIDKKLIISAKISSKIDLSVYNDTKEKIQAEIDAIRTILEENKFFLDGIQDSLEDEDLVEKEVILSLMDDHSKNLKKICSEIEKNEIEVKKVLENLYAENLVESYEVNKYKLVNSVECFKALFKIFDGDIDRKIFISYEFSKNIIKNKLLKYLMNMYNASYNIDEAKKRVELLINSPNAVYLSLNENNLLNLDKNVIHGNKILDQTINSGADL